MSIPRRAFLLQAGGAVAGLSALGCDPQPQGTVPPPAGYPKPQVLVDALERMRTENKAGVAIRLTTDEQRHNPGHNLVNLLNEDPPDSRELVAELVFVCLEDADVRHHLAGADPEHNLLVFDENGRVEAGVQFDYARDWVRFGSAIRLL